jgi:thiosulfate/3-mercaptopyruvate sulfurtransferase
LPAPLIDPNGLAASIDDPQLRVADVRWYLADPNQGAREYDEAHLPGAVFLDLETVLTAGEGPGRHPLPAPAAFTNALGRAGIGPHDLVVAYDDSGGAIAARLWWMLRSIGHRGVRVLDGGFRSWVAAGLPTTTEVPVPVPVAYPPADAWKGVVDVDDVREARVPVVDARVAERYRGETEPVDPRPGHVPGAVNLPYPGNLDADGRFLPAGILARRFREAGVEEGSIVYCGSGVTACHDLLAMEIAGIPGGRLYEGSWSDWSSRPELPASVGPP